MARTERHHAYVRRIGILTMPQPEDGRKPYIIQNNIKWFADRGVDIVPIPYTTRSPEKYMSRIHGLYFQGGAVYNPDYMRNATKLMKLALDANRSGEYFPVWGTCHGFQTMIMVFGEMPMDGSELGYFDARENYTTNVLLTAAGKRARITSEWTPWFKDYIQKGAHVYFANMRGIQPSGFLKNKRLRSMFSMVGVSKDRKGVAFVSIMEGKQVPFYGTQFHAEAVPTLEPFRAFFVEELLKNTRTKVGGRIGTKTFRQRFAARSCTRGKKGFNHLRFQDAECYFF